MFASLLGYKKKQKYNMKHLDDNVEMEMKDTLEPNSEPTYENSPSPSGPVRTSSLVVNVTPRYSAPPAPIKDTPVSFVNEALDDDDADTGKGNETKIVLYIEPKGENLNVKADENIDVIQQTRKISETSSSSEEEISSKIDLDRKISVKGYKEMRRKESKLSSNDVTQ